MAATVVYLPCGGGGVMIGGDGGNIVVFEAVVVVAIVESSVSVVDSVVSGPGSPVVGPTLTKIPPLDTVWPTGAVVGVVVAVFVGFGQCGRFGLEMHWAASIHGFGGGGGGGIGGPGIGGTKIYKEYGVDAAYKYGIPICIMQDIEHL